jgi:cytochrome c553
VYYSPDTADGSKIEWLSMWKVLASGALGILSGCWLPAVSAADSGAGKRAAQQCVECHNARDWSGEGEASLQSLIKDVVDGKVKHKVKIQLSDADIANIAAYWAAASRGK